MLPAFPREGAGTETELRLAIRPDDISRLLEHSLLRAAPAPQPKLLSSVYFDTSDRKLQTAGLSLRVRRLGQRRIQTIKSQAPVSGSPYSRLEWEHDITGDAPDGKFFVGTPLEDLIEADALEPVFETRVKRTIRRVRRDEFDVEVSIDQGEIRAGGRRLPISEVEIERKEGAAHGIFDVALSLGADVPLQLVIRSKSERGYLLADGHETLPWKAMPAPLPSDLPVRAAFLRIGQECLRHFTESMRALLGDLDGDALHQMRVAIRRLRAAMSLFRRILGDVESAAMKSRLTSMADQLAEARDLEVLAARLAELAKAAPGDPGLATLHALVEARREQAFRTAKDAVSATAYHLQVIEIARWLAAGSWTATAKGDKPVAKLATREVTRRRAAVRKSVRYFDELDTTALHQLRIRIKKLRYACEFFDAMFPGKRKKKKAFLSALSNLQTALGDLNDLAVARDLVLAVALAPARPVRKDGAERAAGMVRGRLASEGVTQRKAARKASRRFSEARRFW